MNNITDVKDYCVSGTYSIDASFKATGDSDEQKHVTLAFKADRVPLIDIMTDALRSKRITWVNGPGRSKFDTWSNRSVVTVNYASPAQRIKTREEYISEYQDAFMRARIAEDEALVLATKAVDNPEVIEKHKK